jgi:hypothetical protein
MKAKEMMWEAVKHQEHIAEQGREEVGRLEAEIDRLLATFREQILMKDHEMNQFREILDIEVKVKDSIILKQQNENRRLEDF